MSTKRQIVESSGIYFVTITCYEWMPLFESIKGYDIVYKWFDYLKQLGHYVTGYVIMPNHLHALIAFRHSDKSINSVIGNGKRFPFPAESPVSGTPRNKAHIFFL
ncbi:MAG: hypothetical protein KF775_04475 [Cyclobacteriaceae bacterium]|nr:hypothetical protein [Cyclobacteriaceae bacterium]